MANSLKSVKGMDHVVRDKLAKELCKGCVLGLFLIPPIPDLLVSPLVMVPKKAPGEFCLIHHLSFPRGSSVNNALPENLYSVWYTSFDRSVAMV